MSVNLLSNSSLFSFQYIRASSFPFLTLSLFWHFIFYLSILHSSIFPHSFALFPYPLFYPRFKHSSHFPSAPNLALVNVFQMNKLNKLILSIWGRGRMILRRVLKGRRSEVPFAGRRTAVLKGHLEISKGRFKGSNEGANEHDFEEKCDRCSFTNFYCRIL